ncbi:MAG TPA: hypothetical protein DCM40_33145, partial [Maribacter sp.]|nr:hypothetical protein [Maribacter sp.]
KMLNVITDNRNNSFYEIPFDITFEDARVTDENPPHLATVIFPYRIFEEQASGVTDKYQTVGRIKTDIIIDNSELSLNNYGLRTRDGKLWSGDFYKPSPITFSGTGINNSLKFFETPNTKIQDFRVFKKVSSLLQISSPLDPKNDNGAEFSNFYLTTDRSRNVRFMFGIDCKQIYLKNVKFTKFIDNPKTLDRLMPFMKIKYLKVFRSRFEKGVQQDKLIVFSQDIENGRQLINNSYSEGESTIASLEETYLDQNYIGDSNRVRYFSVTDHKVSQFTAGRYFYRVEIEFEDGTEGFFRKQYAALQRSSKLLEEYIQESVEGMNYHSNRFHQNFIQTDQKAKQDLLAKCLGVYVQNLSIIEGISKTTKEVLIRTIFNMTHPVSGNISGLERFLELIQDLMLRNEALLTKRNYLSSKKKVHNSSFGHIDKTEFKTFVVSREFSKQEDTYVIDCQNNTGFSYLYPEEQRRDSVGLVKVPVSEWNSRIQQEGNKFPGSDSSTVLSGLENTFNFNAENNKNSFLSPISVRAGDNVVKLDDKVDQVKYVGLNALILSRNEEKNISDSDERYYENTIDTEEGSLKEIENFMSKKSVTVVPDDEIEKIKSLSLVSTEENAELNSKKFVGNTNKFDATEKDKKKFVDATISKKPKDIKKITKTSALLSQIVPNQSLNSKDSDGQSKTISQKKTSIKKTNEKFNLENKKNIIDTIQPNKLREIPNQVISMVAKTPNNFKSRNPGHFVRNYLNDAEFNIKINSLQRVEVLVGYGAGLRDTEWRLLTKDTIERLNGNALVRLRPYSNGELGIEDKLKCPVFDEYFLLSSATNEQMSMRVPPRGDNLRVKMSLQPPEYYDHTPVMKDSRLLLDHSIYRNRRVNNIETDLYTSGGQFLLLNGEDYVGFYHVHPTEGPMVGRTHTSEPHERLTRIARTATRRMTTRAQRSTSMAGRRSAATTRTTSGMSGGGSGGGSG